MRATRCSVFTPRRVHEIRYCLKAKLLETNLRMRNNLATLLPHRFCKESVAVTLSTTCDLAIEFLDDLAIECHGSRAIESPDVRVATIVVRVIKRKFATNRFSARNASSKGLCRTLSFFGIQEFCHPCSCRRRVRFFAVGPTFFRARIGPAWRSLSLHTSVMVFSCQCLWCQGAV